MKYQIILLQVLFSCSVFAQNPELIVDYFEGTESSISEWNFEGVNYKGNLFFPISNAEHGEELAIISDGEVELFMDINPGAESSEPENFVEFKDLLYFVAQDELNGFTLWRTDGTPEGTVSFHDPGTSTFSRPLGLVKSASGWMYYSYDGVLYRTDGDIIETVKESGVWLEEEWVNASNKYCLYKDEIAFFANIDSENLGLYTIEDGQEKLLASTPKETFTKSFGLSNIKGGLFFALEDSFEEDITGPYVYNESDGSLSKFLLNGEKYFPRRIVEWDGEKILMVNKDLGFIVINGEEDYVETLYASDSPSFFQGETFENSIKEDKILFKMNEGVWGDSFIIWSDGTEAGTENPLEIIQYTSNMFSTGDYVFIADGTSNGFEPTLYNFDIRDGSFSVIHAFTEDSNQTESVLIVGYSGSKLYFASNLNNELGRELYSIDIDVTINDENLKQTPPNYLKVYGNEIYLMSNENRLHNVLIFNSIGELVQTNKIKPNESIDGSHLKGPHFIKVQGSDHQMVTKFIAR